MSEMDDALAVYLAEIKDENEQFIEELKAQMAEENKVMPKAKASVTTIPQDIVEEEQAPVVPMPQYTMRHHARQSYEAVKKKTVEETPVEMDDRTRAIQMSVEGYSVEEIAKKLGKGKTEIELILKFK